MDLTKVPVWRLEWDSNLRPSWGEAPYLPLKHHAPTVEINVLFRQFNLYVIAINLFTYY